MIMGAWGATHEQRTVVGETGRTLRLVVEDSGHAGHGPTGRVHWRVLVATRYGWSEVSAARHYSPRLVDVAVRHGREALALAAERFGVAMAGA